MKHHIHPTYNYRVEPGHAGSFDAVRLMRVPECSHPLSREVIGSYPDPYKALQRCNASAWVFMQKQARQGRLCRAIVEDPGGVLEECRPS